MGTERKIKAEINTIKAIRGREVLMFRITDNMVSNTPANWRQFFGKRAVTVLAELKKQGFRIFLDWKAGTN